MSDAKFDNWFDWHPSVTYTTIQSYSWVKQMLEATPQLLKSDNWYRRNNLGFMDLHPGFWPEKTHDTIALGDSIEGNLYGISHFDLISTFLIQIDRDK